MSNPYLDRIAKKNTQSTGYRRAPKQEKELAKRVNGMVTRGSGSGRVKGDVRVTGVARIECKTTQNKSFSVTREMVTKIEGAALTNDELPIIHVEFINDKGVPEMEVAVLPFHILQRLLDEITD